MISRRKRRRRWRKLSLIRDRDFRWKRWIVVLRQVCGQTCREGVQSTISRLLRRSLWVITWFPMLVLLCSSGKRWWNWRSTRLRHIKKVILKPVILLIRYRPLSWGQCWRRWSLRRPLIRLLRGRAIELLLRRGTRRPFSRNAMLVFRGESISTRR
jgi:hypothetical protein